MTTPRKRKYPIKTCILIATTLSALVAVAMEPPGITRTQSKRSNNTPASTPSKTPEAQPVALPVSDEDKTLVNAFIAAYSSGEVAELDRVVDYLGLFDEVVAKMDPHDLPSPAAVSNQRRHWTPPGISLELGFKLERPENTLRPGGIRILRHSQIGDHSKVIMRVLPANTTLPKYHGLVIGKGTNNSPRILDLTLEHSATSVAELIRKGLVHARTNEENRQRGIPSKPSVSDEIRQAMKTGGLAAALKVIGSLSLEQKKDADVAGTCLVIASKSDNHADFIAQRTDFLQLHPNLELLPEFIELGFLMKSGTMDSIMGKIERIEKAFPEDSFLSVMRARLLLAREKFDDANEQARLALSQEPDLPEAYDVLLRTAVVREDFRQAATLLKDIRTKFPHIKLDLTTKAEYAKFVTGPEYQELDKANQPKQGANNQTSKNKQPRPDDKWSTLAGTEFSFPFPTKPKVTKNQETKTVTYTFSHQGIETLISVTPMDPQRYATLLTDFENLMEVPGDGTLYYRRRLLLFKEFSAVRLASKSADDWRAVQIVAAPNYSVTISVSSNQPILIPPEVVDTQFDVLVRFAPNERPPELLPN